MLNLFKVWCISAFYSFVRALQDKRWAHAAIGLGLQPLFIGLVALVGWLTNPITAVIFAGWLAVLFGYYMREVAQAQVNSIEWRETYLPWRWRSWDKKQTLYLMAFTFVEGLFIWGINQ